MGGGEFVEIVDGRVSRVHCTIRMGRHPATGSAQVFLEVIPHRRRASCRLPLAGLEERSPPGHSAGTRSTVTDVSVSPVSRQQQGTGPRVWEPRILSQGRSTLLRGATRAH